MSAVTTDRVEPTIPCPDCGQRLVVRRNKETGHEFLGCPKWPVCTHTEPLPEYFRLRRLGAPQFPGFE